ncbi:MAG: VapC toxin family PIN domain ribonuclease [Acidobacteria bacterium]|nr:MAG: VapC toxin family PIN domain ribonuclease [Acidobacteriota bacterium]
MSTALLDVNVLIALLWPAHEHHEAAHRWFAARGRAGWATCPLTEMAFVRIVSNPAFSTDSLAPVEALSLLARNLSHAAHEFWPDDLGLVDALGSSAPRLQGHRQLTDAYLLGLASRRRGALASFDAGLRALAGEDRAPSLQLVPTAAGRRPTG